MTYVSFAISRFSFIILSALFLLLGCGGGQERAARAATPFTSTSSATNNDAVDNSASNAANTLGALSITMLKNKCVSCHGAGKAVGGFGSIPDLDRMVADGLIVPGSPETSKIFLRINSNQMPPGAPLVDKQKALIARWIYNLAIDPTSPFGQVYTQILKPKCLSCHGPTASGGITFDSHAETIKTLVAGRPDISLIYMVTSNSRMPKGKPALSEAELKMLSDWILAGALR